MGLGCAMRLRKGLYKGEGNALQRAVNVLRGWGAGVLVMPSKARALARSILSVCWCTLMVSLSNHLVVLAKRIAFPYALSPWQEPV